jgi:hypothetical protein
MDDSGMLHPLRKMTEEEEKQDALFDSVLQEFVERAQLVQPDGSPVPETWTIFTVGELVEVKGRSFKIGWIGADGVLLEPVRGLVPGGEAP